MLLLTTKRPSTLTGRNVRLSNESFLFSFDAIAQQRLDGFSSNLHRKNVFAVLLVNGGIPHENQPLPKFGGFS